MKIIRIINEASVLYVINNFKKSIILASVFSSFLISVYLWAFFIKVPGIKIKIEEKMNSKDEFILGLVNYVYLSLDSMVFMFLVLTICIIALIFSQIFGISFVYKLGVGHANKHACERPKPTTCDTSPNQKSAQQSDTSETMT